MDLLGRAVDALGKRFDAMCAARVDADPAKEGRIAAGYKGGTPAEQGTIAARKDAAEKSISVMDLNQSYDMLFASINLWLPVQNVDFHKGATGKKQFVRVTCSQGSWDFPEEARVRVRKR